MANSSKSGKLVRFITIMIFLSLVTAGFYFSYHYFVFHSNAEKARKAFMQLRQAENGKKAEGFITEIKNLKSDKKMSEQEWLKVVDIAGPTELSEYAQKAYWKEGVAALNELRTLKANPSRAIELRAKIIAAQAGSKQPFTEFETSPIEISQLVAMNKLRDAARDGQFTIANLQAAGVLRHEKIILKMPVNFTKKTDIKKPTGKAAKIKVASLK